MNKQKLCILTIELLCYTALVRSCGRQIGCLANPRLYGHFQASWINTDFVRDFPWESLKNGSLSEERYARTAITGQTSLPVCLQTPLTLHCTLTTWKNADDWRISSIINFNITLREMNCYIKNCSRGNSNFTRTKKSEKHTVIAAHISSRPWLTPASSSKSILGYHDPPQVLWTLALLVFCCTLSSLALLQSHKQLMAHLFFFSIWWGKSFWYHSHLVITYWTYETLSRWQVFLPSLLFGGWKRELFSILRCSVWSGKCVPFKARITVATELPRYRYDKCVARIQAY